MKQSPFSIFLIGALFSFNAIAQDSAGDGEKKKETPLEKLEKCKAEGWQNWCNEKSVDPSADPAPIDARSVGCLKNSMIVFRDVLETRKSGIASMMSAAGDSSAAATAFHGGQASDASSKYQSDISNAQNASASFASCKSTADKLVKYLKNYSADRESVRNFCTQVKRGANETQARLKIKNFENAAQFHRDVYVKTIPEYAKSAGITEDDAKQFHLEGLEKSTSHDYGSALNNILNELSSNCEKSAADAATHIKDANQSKSIADKQVGQPQSGSDKSAKGAAPKKEGIVDSAKNKLESAGKDTINKGIDKGAGIVQDKAGLTPQAAPVDNNMNKFTTDAPAVAKADTPAAAAKADTPAPAAPAAPKSTASGSPAATAPPSGVSSAVGNAVVSGGTNTLSGAIGNLKKNDDSLNNQVNNPNQAPALTADQQKLKDQCAKLIFPADASKMTAAQRAQKDKCTAAGFAFITK